MPSRAEPLAAARPTGIEHLATAGSGHSGPETMPALTHQLARLIGPLHGFPLLIKPQSSPVSARGGSQTIAPPRQRRAPRAAAFGGISLNRRLIREGLGPVNAAGGAAIPPSNR